MADDLLDLHKPSSERLSGAEKKFLIIHGASVLSQSGLLRKTEILSFYRLDEADYGAISSVTEPSQASRRGDDIYMIVDRRAILHFVYIKWYTEASPSYPTI